MLKLSNSCDVAPQVAHLALFAAEKKVEELRIDCHSVTNNENKTWAVEVNVAGTAYVVGQLKGKTQIFVCFPLPYAGNQRGVRPFNTVNGLLRQLSRLEK